MNWTKLSVVNLNKEKIDRILKWFSDSTSLPFKIVLIPTNRCNLRCPYCPNALPRSKRMFERKDELSTKKWEEVIEEGLKLGVKEWSIIGGGEPFLRKDVVLKAVELIKNNPGTDCEIITNGTLISKKDVLKLVKNGLDRILFSIDAPNARLHDSLRGVKGTFKKVTRTVRFFDKTKKRFKKQTPYIKVNTVLSKVNIDKIERMVRFVAEIGGQELALHPMRKYHKAESLKQLSVTKREKNELENHIRNAMKISENFGIYLNIDMVKMENGTTNRKEVRKKSTVLRKIERCSCFEPFYTMLIDPNGFVNGCSPSGRGIKSLNVKEKSLLEIWFSEELSELRNVVLKGGKFDYCSKCGLTDMRFYIRSALIEVCK